VYATHPFFLAHPKLFFFYLDIQQRPSILTSLSMFLRVVCLQYQSQPHFQVYSVPEGANLCNNYSTILFQVYPELEGAGVGANLCNNYSKLSIKEEVSFSGNTSLQ
jgi:hypothetical protein